MVDERRGPARREAVDPADGIDRADVAVAQRYADAGVEQAVPAAPERPLRRVAERFEAGRTRRLPGGEKRHWLKHDAGEWEGALFRDDRRGERGGALRQRRQQNLINDGVGVGEDAGGGFLDREAETGADAGVARQDRGILQPRGADLCDAVLRPGENRVMTGGGECAADRDDGVEIAQRTDGGKDDAGHARERSGAVLRARDDRKDDT